MMLLPDTLALSNTILVSNNASLISNSILTFLFSIPSDIIVLTLIICVLYIEFVKKTLKQVPVLLRAITYIAIIFGSIFKLNSILSWSDFILLLTGIVILIYTYYTHKLARVSTISAALLAARQDHTKDLKEFVKSWRFGGYFYDSYDDYDGNSPRNRSNTFKAIITSDWKYNDLIVNHLLEDNGNLSKFCKCYEDTIDKYNKLRDSLIISIRCDLAKELEAHNKKDIFLTNHGGLAGYLYPHYASILGPNRNEYYITGNKVSSFAYNLEGTEIIFQPTKKTSHMSPQVVGSADFNLRSINLADQLEKFLTEYYFNKYKDDILKIYSTEQELDRLKEEINEILDRILRLPLLPGINCDILKYLLSDDIK